MPNPHYQHVLEQDAQLPAPLRLLTRAMSSWWTIGTLSVLVAGYLVFAYVPFGDRYLWQTRPVDSTKHLVLTWWPMNAAMLLLAVVVVWAAIRRLPMRWANLGVFVAVLGLSTMLISQSIAWQYRSVGVAAIKASKTDANGEADPLKLRYTTRFGDTTKRELVVMAIGQAPITVPLDGLPRWNDAAGEQLPALDMNQNAKLRQLLGFGVRIRPVAYVADGQLAQADSGKQTAKPTPPDERTTTSQNYPERALIAVRFDVESQDGGRAATTLWLPFDPETDSLTPKQFFNIEGLGVIGLAFRPQSHKLPFALAATKPRQLDKAHVVTLHLADSDNTGKLLQPATFDYGLGQHRHGYHANTEDGTLQAFSIYHPRELPTGEQLVFIHSGPRRLFIYAGLLTLVAGLLLLGITELRARLKRYGKQPIADSPYAPA